MAHGRGILPGFGLTLGTTVAYVGLVVLIPICAHTLTTRPLVVPDRSTIQVSLITRERHVHLNVDGRDSLRLEPGDTVTLTPSAHNLLLFGSPSMNYYEILRTKLRWGEY